MIRVLIAGYHGFGNCGDEAILQAMTANIRAMAKRCGDYGFKL